MKAFVEGLIDKRLAHKQDVQNVFVQALRRAVPGTFARSVVNGQILPALSEEDRTFFLEYYQPWTTASGEPAYTLFNIPHRLAATLFDSKVTGGPFSPIEQKTLGRYYVASDNPEYRVLKGAVTEMEDVVLAEILDPKGLTLTETERMRIANLLESVPGLQHDDIFHAALYLDPTHPYFFEHPNEHVPGMLIIEAGRQMGMACWHTFGRTPFDGVQFILESFNTRFLDYLELSYPCYLKGELIRVERGSKGEWLEVGFRVGVFQRGELSVELEIHGQVISKRSFQRLRAGRLVTDPLHRFLPIETIHHKVSLWDPVGERYVRVKLWDISMEGLRVEFLDGVEESNLPADWEAILYFEDLGFIRSRCTLAWHRREKQLHWAGFRFNAMAKVDRAVLQAAIRQYCHLRREREQL